LETKGKILIIEDSTLQAETLARSLSRKGYSVTSAQDGLEGLHTLKESTPRLIISDIWMPKMTGLEFCSAVKSHEDLQDIPIMLLTTLSTTMDIVNGLNSGADYYLTKPYSEDLLLSMVDSILSNGDPSIRDNKRSAFTKRVNEKIIDIIASPQQILNFLFSTYENLLRHNRTLNNAKQELRKLNSQLEERVREKTESIESTLNGVVSALATAVELRDPYTAGHQLRVSQLACAIAQEIGLSNEQIEGIRVMGFLHDIGKIIVPAEILSKPSKLNDYEFNFIKAHPEAGYNILKGIVSPWPVATAVLQHHERVNGSGYPSGCMGDEIIIEAKIIAVSDVIESMASHRPYRAALGIEAALEEIQKNEGIIYDFEVVEACSELFCEKGFKFE
jgi:putative two-component system response regulator